MFEIFDIYTGKVLLGKFTTEVAAKKAALIIFPDRMWNVRKAEA